jgi:putative MFS transporter
LRCCSPSTCRNFFRPKCGCACRAFATPSAAGTIITPFIVVALFAHYSVVGVLVLMIGLLAIQIVVVGALGVDSTGQRLEDIQPGGARTRRDVGADARVSPLK